MTWCHCVGSVQ